MKELWKASVEFKRFGVASDATYLREWKKYRNPVLNQTWKQDEYQYDFLNRS